MNEVIDKLSRQNEAFAKDGFAQGLKMLPTMKTMIIGCVDPRVDPGQIFGLQDGEAAVIRNVGGRVFPSTIQTMGMLAVVAKTQGGEVGAGWNLIVLHHTDCGINCLGHQPQMLAKHFDVEAVALEKFAISDPFAAVAVDVATLKATPQINAALTVTGMVYDVATGRATVVVPSACIREAAAQ